jgi:HPr kinase/phosphorylase
MISIQVAELLRDREYNLDLQLVAGKKGLFKKLTIPRIQKPGLGLTGDTSHLHAGRLQVLGRSEIEYLKGLNQTRLEAVIKKICEIDISAMVVTRGNQTPDTLIKEAEASGIPLFSTNLLTSTFVNRVSRFLEDKLTASTTVHGVMMDIFGVGILLIGKSGIGKSEAALDLILRGQRLVADDVVEIKKKPPNTLSAMSSSIIKFHMEIRGLGILNVEDLFGVAAIRDRKVVDIVIELEEWNPKEEYDRLGLDEQTYPILDVQVPYLKIPVRPGRNVTAIIEVAARNHLLKQRGHFSAQEFDEKLNQDLANGEKMQKQLWNSLE